MQFFDCGVERLAAVFAENPLAYNEFINVLRVVESRGVLSQDIEKSLPEIYEFLNRANGMARNFDYFMFSVYDSWADEQVGNGEGYIIYQKGEDEMIERMGLTSDSPHSLEHAIKFLQKQEVRRVYTLHIPIGGFFGVKDNFTDDDGDYVEKRALEEHDIVRLSNGGIEVVVLTP